jgi:hypothetical protein
MTPTRLFILCAACLCVVGGAFADSRFKLPTPRQPISVKLNQQHLQASADPVTTAEIVEEDELDFFFGEDVFPWDDSTSSSNDTALENIWLLLDGATADNSTENTTLLIESNKTSSLIDQLIDTINAAFSSPNASAEMDFTFITHIQLAPHACPSDATRLFNQALHSSNPAIEISSKTIRAGSILCNDDCPCPERSTRRLATTTIVIQTTSKSKSLHMPTKLQFPMDYEVVSTS